MDVSPLILSLFGKSYHPFYNSLRPALHKTLIKGILKPVVLSQQHRQQCPASFKIRFVQFFQFRVRVDGKLKEASVIFDEKPERFERPVIGIPAHRVHFYQVVQNEKDILLMHAQSPSELSSEASLSSPSAGVLSSG